MEKEKIKKSSKKFIFPEKYKQEFSDVLLKANIKRMYYFCIYMFSLQFVLQMIELLKSLNAHTSGGAPKFISYFITLSQSSLIVGLIFFVLLRLVRKEKIKSRKLKVLIVNSILYLYMTIQLAFCTVNILYTGNIISYMILVLIIGLVPIQSSKKTLTLITSIFAYNIIFMYSTRTISKTWNSALSSDMWTNYILIAGLTSIVSVFIYNLYKSNFLKSKYLEESNDNLENQVRERTKELEKQTIAAQSSSRAKSDFLARMSHEIRTPLNAIMGMAQIAKMAETRQKTINSIDEILTASTHLLGILNDILDMSKIESGKFKLSCDNFNLRTAMNEVEKIISIRCDEIKIKFTTNIDIPNINVHSDKLRLKQVLINLLGNSVKFTAQNGNIDFRLETVKETAKDITVKFTVKDTGIGMSKEQIAKLFQPFEQGNNDIAIRYGGTGLGLSISQNLVKLLGGQIEVESESGSGSEFTFTICFEKSQEEVKDNNSYSTVDFTGKRILLVEDVQINRIIVKELLKNTNVTIDEAEDGLKALEMFSSSQLNYYDFIFMDIQMPNMNGYESSVAIRGLDRSDAKSVPIYAMSANAYKDDIDNSIESGMNGHISKPIDLPTIIKVLAQCFSK